jgi:hypothetical protein
MCHMSLSINTMHGLIQTRETVPLKFSIDDGWRIYAILLFMNAEICQ